MRLLSGANGSAAEPLSVRTCSFVLARVAARPPSPEPAVASAFYLRFTPVPIGCQIASTAPLLANFKGCRTIALRRATSPASKSLCGHKSCAKSLRQSKPMSDRVAPRWNLRWPTKPALRLTESSSQSSTRNSSLCPATRCARLASNCLTHSNALKHGPPLSDTVPCGQRAPKWQGAIKR